MLVLMVRCRFWSLMLLCLFAYSVLSSLLIIVADVVVVVVVAVAVVMCLLSLFWI